LNPGILYAGTDYHVLKSTDFGERWTVAASFSVVYSLAIIPPSTILAGGSRGVHRSDDGGSTWRPIGLGKYRVLALAASPANDQEIFAGTKRSLYRTSDGGGTWRFVPGLLVRSVTGLQFNPVKPNVVYASTYDAGVFRTLDGGETWAEFNEGLVHRGVRSIAIDDSGRSIFAATFFGGVYEYRVAPKSVLPTLQRELGRAGDFE
jgi:photosystem II stability/assembly factor-like uncharacterized protein